jgi:hypothetical protein
MKRSIQALFTVAVIVLSNPWRLHAGADHFSSATEIVGRHVWLPPVSLLTYTGQPSEGSHYDNGPGARKSAWWKWTAPATGFCTVDTQYQNGNDFVADTALAVYTGGALNMLTRVAYSDRHQLGANSAAPNTSSATFYAQEGVTYRIAVDGQNPEAVNAANHRVALRLRLMEARPERRIGAVGNAWEDWKYARLELNRTSGHAFSAKLTLGGRSLPIKGVFSTDGYFTTAIEVKTPAGVPPRPPLTLMIDGAFNGGFEIYSVATGSTGFGLQNVRVHHAGNPHDHRGWHTARAGDGVLGFAVSAGGQVKGAGVLADGSKITFGSQLCHSWNEDGAAMPFVVPLYRGNGFYQAYLRLVEGGAVDTVGSYYVDHHRPAQWAGGFYEAGFNDGSAVKGGTYLPPGKDQRALGFLEATMGAGLLKIADASDELAPVMQNLELDAKNRFVFPPGSALRPQLKLNPKTGFVTGSLFDESGRRRSLTGILHQHQGAVGLTGHVSGFAYNPRFEVAP